MKVSLTRAECCRVHQIEPATAFHMGTTLPVSSRNKNYMALWCQQALGMFELTLDPKKKGSYLHLTNDLHVSTAPSLLLQALGLMRAWTDFVEFPDSKLVQPSHKKKMRKSVRKSCLRTLAHLSDLESQQYLSLDEHEKHKRDNDIISCTKCWCSKSRYFSRQQKNP